MFDSSLEDFLFHSQLFKDASCRFITKYLYIFLLGATLFDQFAFLKASTTLYSHPAKPRAEGAVSKSLMDKF